MERSTLGLLGKSFCDGLGTILHRLRHWNRVDVFDFCACRGKVASGAIWNFCVGGRCGGIFRELVSGAGVWGIDVELRPSFLEFRRARQFADGDDMGHPRDTVCAFYFPKLCVSFCTLAWTRLADCVRMRRRIHDREFVDERGGNFALGRAAKRCSRIQSL